MGFLIRRFNLRGLDLSYAWIVFSLNFSLLSFLLFSFFCIYNFYVYVLFISNIYLSKSKNILKELDTGLYKIFDKFCWLHIINND